MDAIFAEMDGRVKVSLTDSTMMKIVRLAMDKAQEKLMSKHGVIGRLIEISKFYELAVMQLEGCLKFVQEETDSSNLEGWHEDVLDDLSGIKDRLQGRLEETEMAIMEKDRELRERIQLELRLRHALQMKERELVSLRAKLELEKTKSEGIEEQGHGNRISVEEGRDEEFSELMHSLDQQVSNIEQKLEPESMFMNEEHSRKGGTIDNKKIEQMGSDIHILKETFNLAFGKMQNAILLSEMEPSEQQWRWDVEESIFGVLVKGFLKDLEDSFGAEVRKRESQVSVALSEHLSNLMNEMTNLRSELESLTTQSEDQAKNAAKIPPKPSPKNVGEVDQQKAPKEEDGGNFVAKMIKNHESIIRRKCEELNWLRGDTLQEKDDQPTRRHKGADVLKRRIQQVISRLDNLISWNSKLGETLSSRRSDLLEEVTYSNMMLYNVTETQKSGNDTFEDVWEKINRGPVSRVATEELHNEIRMLKQEKEDRDMQHKIMEATYASFFEGLVNEFGREICNHDTESLMLEGVSETIVREMVSEWKEILESNKIESQITDELNCIVFTEAIKNHDYSQDLLFANIWSVLINEMLKEWKEDIEIHNFESLVEKEIYQIVVDKTIKSVVNSANDALTNFQEIKVQNDDAYADALFQIAEDSEVCKVFFKETVKEWNGRMDGYRDLVYANELCRIAEDSVNADVCKVFLRETVNEWKMRIHALHANDQPFQLLEDSLVADIYKVFFKETVKEYEDFICANKLLQVVEDSLKTDVWKVFCRETINEWKMEVSAYIDFIHANMLFLMVEHSVSEEVCNIFLKEMVREWKMEIDAYRDSSSAKEVFRIAEDSLKEDVCTIFLKETLNEWKMEIDAYKTKSHIEHSVREDVCKAFLKEMVNEWKMEIGAYRDSSHAKEILRIAEDSVKEDVCRVFLKETFNETKMEIDACKTESLIEQEMHQFVIVEVLKDASVFGREVDSPKQDIVSDNIISANNFDEGLDVNGEENMIQKLDSLETFLELEEDEILSVGSEVKNDKQYLELVGLEHEQSNEHDPEKSLDHWIPVTGVESDREVSCSQSTDNEERELSPLDPVFLPLLRFPQILQEFGSMVDIRIGMYISRLEEVKRYIDRFVEHNATLRKSESLYKEAFIRRCQNLHKAEVEVDLLGDQVDVLLDVMKKIYKTISQNLPFLHHCSEVSDILKLIKNVLVVDDS